MGSSFHARAGLILEKRVAPLNPHVRAELCRGSIHCGVVRQANVANLSEGPFHEPQFSGEMLFRSPLNALHAMLFPLRAISRHDPSR